MSKHTLGKYIEQNGEPIPEDDLLAWAKWYETAARRVGDTSIGKVRVSTVFLGIDHQFGNGPPLLYETMVFGGISNEEQWRYPTRIEAEAEHAAVVERVRATIAQAEGE